MSGSLTGTAASHLVHDIRMLSESAFVLRFDRGGLDFVPGQYISVGLQSEVEMREYSVYSSPDDDFLEILVKEVTGGSVSRKLRRTEPGVRLSVDGPFGFFTMNREIRESGKLVFIATGTGISPFHCFARAYPELTYTMLHGVRTVEELYEHTAFPADRVTACISRSDPGEARGRSPGTQIVGGRVTDYLRSNAIDPDSFFYLCGNCDMIYEAFDVLKSKGAQPEHLYAEVYF